MQATQKYAIEKKISEEVAQKHVQEILDKMIATFSSNITRSFEYVMTKILKRLFVSIHVDDEGLKMVHKFHAAPAANSMTQLWCGQVKELEEKGVPVVLIPTHKSHIDYIVMSIICFHYNLPLPYIAAGDNLNIPIVGYLFRSICPFLSLPFRAICIHMLTNRRAGAFFIRREFAGDPLYSLIFRCYVEQILNDCTSTRTQKFIDEQSNSPCDG